MTTKMNMVRDINGFNTFILPACDLKYNVNLASGAPQALILPSDSPSYTAILAIEPGCTVWVSVGHTALVPGGTIASTFSEMNPPGITVKAGEVISFVTSDTTCELGIKLYAI